MNTNIKNLKAIDLVWEEPYNVGYCRETDRYNLNHIPSDVLDEKGIYQVYGRHPVYGENVLLYIGETKFNRSFKDRLYEHIRPNGKLFWYTNLSISLCPISGYTDKEIEIAESILIAVHKPALNKKFIDSAMKASERYIVRNWGFIKSLQNESTGLYVM